MTEDTKTTPTEPRRRDTTLPPHVDDALVAFAKYTNRSISASLALAAERGIVELANDIRPARAATLPDTGK